MVTEQILFSGRNTDFMVRSESGAWLLDGLSPELVVLSFVGNKSLSFLNRKIRRGFIECLTQQNLTVVPTGWQAAKENRMVVLKSSENRILQDLYTFNVARSVSYTAWVSGSK